MYDDLRKISEVHESNGLSKGRSLTPHPPVRSCRSGPAPRGLQGRLSPMGALAADWRLKGLRDGHRFHRDALVLKKRKPEAPFPPVFRACLDWCFVSYRRRMK